MPTSEWLVQGDAARYTFGEHDRLAHACVAAKLTELGVERGDRVALVFGEHSRVGAHVLGVRDPRRASSCR